MACYEMNLRLRALGLDLVHVADLWEPVGDVTA